MSIRACKDISRAFGILLILLLSIVGLAARQGPGQNAKLGEFDGHGDVGSPRLAGSAAYNPVSQEYSMAASGVNMWAERDEFHFAWKRLTGDFILQTRVQFVGKGVEAHRKAGLIVRAGQEADAPYVDAVVHGDGLTSLQFRRTKGGATEEKQSTIKGADVLQLERKDNTFIMSSAKFGDPYTTTEIADMNLGADVLAGLALCSHNPDVIERAVFSNVRIIKPAPDTFKPYTDYLGSVLELLDVESGRRQVLMRSQDPFEAPNWTRDGGSLIYNTSGRGEGRGRLIRYNLATRQGTPIDTGSSNRNNNDHVLSFDGTMQIWRMKPDGASPEQLTNDGWNNWFPHISPDGQWVAFISFPKEVSPSDHPYYKRVMLRLMPAGGGTPRAIAYVYGGQGTINVPSWSPDGRMLAFVSNSGPY